MRRILIAVAFILAFAVPASAQEMGPERQGLPVAALTAFPSHIDRHAVSGGLRPRRWCAWWLNLHLVAKGKQGSGSNLAASFFRVGRPSAPHVGAIAVNRHHVCEVVAVNGAIIQCLGGNQGRGGVTVATFAMARFSYRAI